jgi:hypothetical protein
VMLTRAARKYHFEQAKEKARLLVALAAFEVARDAAVMIGTQEDAPLGAELAAIGLPDDVATEAIDTLKKAAPEGIYSFL